MGDLISWVHNPGALAGRFSHTVTDSPHTPDGELENILSQQSLMSFRVTYHDGPPGIDNLINHSPMGHTIQNH